tara:strand:+ start:3907 stop:4599 length:693 start_codon:yes stop_codon:yes gene_type:complete
MKKKVKEQAQAVKLRLKGKSINEIAEAVGCSKGSISLWVKDVEISEAQMRLIEERGALKRAIGGQNGADLNKAKYANLRTEYEKEGKKKAKEKDWLHVAGCFLYWGEGSKSRNTVSMANTDPCLLKLFVRFLRESLSTDDCDIKIDIIAYSSNGYSANDLIDFWTTELSLPKSCVRGVRFDTDKRKTSGKNPKHPYGMAAVVVNNTKSLCHIRGAIEEYAGCTMVKWKDK